MPHTNSIVEIPNLVYQNIQALKDQFYKDSAFCFFFGSFSTGEQVPGSDIDLIFVYDKVIQPIHEKINFQDQLYDIFVFDVETLNGTLHNARQHGEFALVHAVMNGITLPAETDTSSMLKTVAQRIRKAGYLFKESSKARTYITGILKDLERDLPATDRNMLVVELYRSLTRILLIAGGEGICTGKSAPRSLRKIKPELFIHLDQALVAAMNGDLVNLMVYAKDILKIIGGPLNDGFRTILPDFPRMPLPVI